MSAVDNRTKSFRRLSFLYLYVSAEQFRRTPIHETHIKPATVKIVISAVHK